MKRVIFLVALLGIAGPTGLAQTIHISPDVPADPDGAFLLPWDVIECDSTSAVPYTTVLTVPGDPALGAVHKMDTPGGWLFSVEAPDDLAGSLGGGIAEPRDVIRTIAGAYSFFFDGSCVGGVVPPESDIDALYLDGGDVADLVVSFDVPTTIGAATFQPSELVRYARVGVGPCGWALVGSVIDFSATSALYYPSGTNVTGADWIGDRWIVAFDIPVDLQPSAPYPGPTYEPGFVASFHPATLTWDLFKDLQVVGAPGWQLDGYVDALSCGANPARVYDRWVYPFPIMLDKSGVTPGNIVIDWSPSCSDAEDYAIYEGTLASLLSGPVYDHVPIPVPYCTDAGGDTQEDITPSAVDTYYLVVPLSCSQEGSYGIDSNLTERPQAAAASRCEPVQNLSACP